MRIILTWIIMLAFAEAYAGTFTPFDPKSILVSEHEHGLIIKNKSGTYKKFVYLDNSSESAKFSKIYLDMLLSQAIEDNKDIVINNNFINLYGNPSHLVFKMGICETNYIQKYGTGYEGYLRMGSAESVKGEPCKVRYGVIMSPARINFQLLKPWPGRSKMQTALDGKIVFSDTLGPTVYQEEFVRKNNLVLKRAKLDEASVLLTIGIMGFKVRRVFYFDSP